MNQLCKTFLLAVALLLAAVLAGCASPTTISRSSSGSYVVLLVDRYGKLGSVTVQSPRGEEVLTQAYKAASLDGSRGTYYVMEDEMRRDFGAAMAARPPLPEQFLLYFETGGAELTVESKAKLQEIVDHARARTALDMSVIGHTDTVGGDDINEPLALERANAIAQQLRQLGLPNAPLTVESHGKRNLLVPTADDTPEQGNRRVEVILR
jgi:adhesin transport system outer membrane protein